MSSSNALKLRGISDRVKALVRGRYGRDVRGAAAELGMPEIDLRALLELHLRPLPPDLLAGSLVTVVRHFGVDPGWLVSGHYDVRSHEAAEEQRNDSRALRQLLEQLLTARRPERVVSIGSVERADRGPSAADEASAHVRDRGRGARGSAGDVAGS